MIRKDKIISLFGALLCSIILALIYILLVESNIDYFVLVLLFFPSFALFLSIFTAIADIKIKQNKKADISFLIQSIIGLITWISLVLCFSDINNEIKSITIAVFAISFILFIISFGFTNAFEENEK